MVRAALLLVLAIFGYAVVTHDAFEIGRLEDKLIWAALLPAIYILGLALLRD